MTRIDWPALAAWLGLALFALYVWAHLVAWVGWGVVPLTAGAFFVLAAVAVRNPGCAAKEAARPEEDRPWADIQQADQARQPEPIDGYVWSYSEESGWIAIRLGPSTDPRFPGAFLC